MSFPGSSKAFKNSVGIDVYYQLWEAEEKTAQVVFCHGEGEHFSRYSEIFEQFAENGIRVMAFDQVGCGETGVKANSLGRPLGMDQTMKDLTEAIIMVHDSSIPLFLMGHSYGGLIVLNYLADGRWRKHVHGAIVSSPYIEAAKEVHPYFISSVAQMSASYLMPNYKMKLGSSEKSLSRDQKAVDAYLKDPLNTFSCTLMQNREQIITSQHLIYSGYKKIELNNLLICHGTADAIASYDATDSLAEKITRENKVTDFEMSTCDGGFHDLMFEEDGDETVCSYIQWIHDHTPAAY
ncbi:hypothetical protein DSO57_1009677 [Entomophthora muscae]|uniref:Uncharacterized protein n=1 Tax=Entomophthora muscae TaxID=34485 RepID=A0ACC2TI73_9FUNG|nr:hypothetical protein DSO57_1009677 [Entomophthora muscae]